MRGPARVCGEVHTVGAKGKERPTGAWRPADIRCPGQRNRSNRHLLTSPHLYMYAARVPLFMLSPPRPPPQPPKWRRRPGHGGDTSEDAITNRPGPPATGPARLAPTQRAGLTLRRVGQKCTQKAAAERAYRERRCECSEAPYLRESWRSSPFCAPRTTPRRNWRGRTASARRARAHSAPRKRSSSLRCSQPANGAGHRRRTPGQPAPRYWLGQGQAPPTCDRQQG